MYLVSKQYQYTDDIHVCLPNKLFIHSPPHSKIDPSFLPQYRKSGIVRSVNAQFIDDKEKALLVYKTANPKNARAGSND